jgi:hypothetical protein
VFSVKTFKDSYFDHQWRNVFIRTSFISYRNSYCIVWCVDDGIYCIAFCKVLPIVWLWFFTPIRKQHVRHKPFRIHSTTDSHSIASPIWCNTEAESDQPLTWPDLGFEALPLENPSKHNLNFSHTWNSTTCVLCAFTTFKSKVQYVNVILLTVG